MLSRRSIDMMLDLIENRVACMQVIDREDHRQLAILTQARKEILSLSAQVKREDRGKPRSLDTAPTMSSTPIGVPVSLAEAIAAA